MASPINFFPIDRHWFLTWTTYGTWLPGDERGYVGKAEDRFGDMVKFNELNTPSLPPNQALRRSAESVLKHEITRLDVAQAKALLEQFQETALHRRWLLNSVGIMQTHLHVVVGVSGDPDPEKILRDLKAYGSRRLNRLSSDKFTLRLGELKGQISPTHQPLPDSRGRKAAGSEIDNVARWTMGGSKRKLQDEPSIVAANEYVRRQPNPMLIWTREHGILFSGGDTGSSHV